MSVYLGSDMKVRMSAALCIYLISTLFHAVAHSCPLECHCEGLGRVQCQGASITKFPIGIPVSTSYLYINNTGILSLNSQDFKNVSGSLQYLIINSELKQISAETFEGLARLELLNLAGTKIHAPPQLKNLGNLTGLLLSNNKIEELSREAFEGLGQLRDLDLSNNMLKGIPEGLFDDLVNLEKLLLNDNQITQLSKEVFSRLSKLQWLFLSSNQLSELPEGIFSNLPTLSNLTLFENQLKRLPTGTFGPMPLRELWLYDNNLTHLEEKVFCNLTRLNLLAVSQNSISKISVHALQGLVALEEVSLHTNRLTELPADMFSGLPNLMNISLEHNQLSSLHKDLLNGLHKLHHFDLHNNSLQNLPQKLLYSLESAKKVILYQNPWKCDHNIIPLYNWLKSHQSQVPSANAVVCSWPLGLRNTSLAKLSGEVLGLPGNKDTLVIIVVVVCTVFIGLLFGYMWWSRWEKKAFPPGLIIEPTVLTDSTSVTLLDD